VRGQETVENWLEVLKKDQRLKSPVNYEFKKRPTEADLFGILEKATGVRLKVAPQSEKGKITFGSISALNTPAWRIMRNIATNQVDEGRWEKVDDGYVLHGKPKNDVGMVILTPEAEKAQDEKNKRVEDARAKAAKVREDYAKWHPLGLDPKLHAKVSVVGKDPNVFEILNRVSAATGYKMTVADNLKYHDPKYGMFQMNNAFAYSFMEIIASKHIIDGRWVKTADGYQLEGESRELNLPPTPPSSSRWVWAVVSVIVVLMTASAFIVYRRRTAKAPSPPAPLPKGEGSMKAAGAS